MLHCFAELETETRKYKIRKFGKSNEENKWYILKLAKRKSYERKPAALAKWELKSKNDASMVK